MSGKKYIQLVYQLQYSKTNIHNIYLNLPFEFHIMSPNTIFRFGLVWRNMIDHIQSVELEISNFAKVAIIF